MRGRSIAFMKMASQAPPPRRPQGDRWRRQHSGVALLSGGGRSQQRSSHQKRRHSRGKRHGFLCEDGHLHSLVMRRLWRPQGKLEADNLMRGGRQTTVRHTMRVGAHNVVCGGGDDGGGDSGSGRWLLEVGGAPPSSWEWQRWRWRLPPGELMMPSTR